MPRSGFLAVCAAQLRNLFAREVLPPAPAAPPRAPRGSFAKLLLSVEPLAEDPVPPRHPRSGGLTALFAPERLPLDAELPPPPRRTKWLRWLFAAEPLDRDPNRPETP
jgi:hypothetical protein